MQDHSSLSVLKLEKDRRERDVLESLLESRSGWPLSVKEIALMVGDDVLAVEAVAGLHASGLVHRNEEFVFPTRAAARYHELW